MKFVVAILIASFATAASAETGWFGNVQLLGLARATWNSSPVSIDNVMVCNINLPDGTPSSYLSVREYPTTDAKVIRNLERLAILKVDITNRVGNWVQILAAWRENDVHGNQLANVISFDNVISGWVHDGYLCSYIDHDSRD